MQLDKVLGRAALFGAWLALFLLGVATVGYIYGGIWVLAAIW